jgi:hypothetical protein
MRSPLKSIIILFADDDQEDPTPAGDAPAVDSVL